MKTVKHYEKRCLVHIFPPGGCILPLPPHYKRKKMQKLLEDVTKKLLYQGSDIFLYKK